MATLNVKTQYGAVGDGVTNDATPIANAFAAAQSGDVVYFPAGTYRCTAAPIFLYTGVTARGESSSNTTLVRDLGATGTALFRINGTDVTVEHLSFNAKLSVNFASCILLEEHVAHRFTCQNCVFTNAESDTAQDNQATLHFVIAQYVDGCTLSNLTTTRGQLKGTSATNFWAKDITCNTPLNYGISNVAIVDTDDVSGTIIERVTVNGIHPRSAGGIYVGNDRLESIGKALGILVQDITVSGTWQTNGINTPAGIQARACRISRGWTFRRITISGTPSISCTGLNVDWCNEPTWLERLSVSDCTVSGCSIRNVTIGGAIRGCKIASITAPDIGIFSRYAGIKCYEATSCSVVPTLDTSVAPITAPGIGQTPESCCAVLLRSRGVKSNPTRIKSRLSAN